MPILTRLRKPSVGRIAFNMRPANGPFGGSSAFVSQLSAFLRRRGFKITFSLDRKVDLVVLIDPRDDLENLSFSLDEIRRYTKLNPQVALLHRINECDQRKSTSFMDPLLKAGNEHADYTVFISEWLRNYHSDRWFDTANPHDVIYNGADSAVFYPIGQTPPRPKESFRIVTHHWSPNVMKGFPVYVELDRLIAERKLSGVELWVIGRWPNDITWKSATTFGPMHGSKLAEKLRSCHAYVTGSLWEPCGMHHVEGAQCGLPLLYHVNGGGIVEAGEKYGIAYGDDVEHAVEEMRKHYEHYRVRLLDNIPSGERMCLEYAEVIQKLICTKRLVV